MFRTGKEIAKGLGQAAAQAGFDKMIKGGPSGPLIKPQTPPARPMPPQASKPAPKPFVPKAPVVKPMVLPTPVFKAPGMQKGKP